MTVAMWPERTALRYRATASSIVCAEHNDTSTKQHPSLAHAGIYISFPRPSGCGELVEVYCLRIAASP